MNKVISVIYIFFTLLISGCRHYYSESEFKEYISIPRNGLIQTTEIDDYKITTAFKPSRLLYGKEEYNTTSLFELRIQYKEDELQIRDVYNEREHEQLIENLSFRMKDDLFLVNKVNDTIGALSVRYIPMYNTTQYTSLLCQFNCVEEDLKNSDFRFIIKGNKINIPDASLSFNKNDFKKLERKHIKN